MWSSTEDTADTADTALKVVVSPAIETVHGRIAWVEMMIMLCLGSLPLRQGNTPPGDAPLEVGHDWNTADAPVHTVV
ncbi:hypothetical protein GCM10009754_27910 [Amycolatopsis minnesotensis]|uniref:Uncharacterized protein n=1 Tax=Amycolatopsis minnesotensis TaxID=337894 RepID=A0ABN2QSK1_9PSEU